MELEPIEKTINELCQKPGDRITIKHELTLDDGDPYHRVIVEKGIYKKEFIVSLIPDNFRKILNMALYEITAREGGKNETPTNRG